MFRQTVILSSHLISHSQKLPFLILSCFPVIFQVTCELMLLSFYFRTLFMFSVSLSLTESKIFCPLPTLPVFSHLIYCQCHLVEEAPPKQSALCHPLCGLPMPLCSRGQDSLSLLCVLCLPLFGLLPHFAEVGVNGRQII